MRQGLDVLTCGLPAQQINAYSKARVGISLDLLVELKLERLGQALGGRVLPLAIAASQDDKLAATPQDGGAIVQDGGGAVAKDGSEEDCEAMDQAADVAGEGPPAGARAADKRKCMVHLLTCHNSP